MIGSVLILHSYRLPSHHCETMTTLPVSGTHPVSTVKYMTRLDFTPFVLTTRAPSYLTSLKVLTQEAAHLTHTFTHTPLKRLSPSHPESAILSTGRPTAHLYSFRENGRVHTYAPITRSRKKTETGTRRVSAINSNIKIYNFPPSRSRLTPEGMKPRTHANTHTHTRKHTHTHTTCHGPVRPVTSRVTKSNSAGFIRTPRIIGSTIGVKHLVQQI